MATPLIHTKLVVPPLRAGMLARPRLIAQLNAGLSRRLTLISAPPGYGKTSILSAWARQVALPIAWLTLDDGDNEAVRFVLYIAATLQRLHPRIAATATALLERPQSTTTMILTELTNSLAEYSPQALLVLDDYHVIHEQSIHDIVLFLLEHAPPGVHLVVAARADPPLPVALLRGRGLLNELRAADLRFSPAEVALLLEGTGLQLRPEDIAALAVRTEGWPAGLQLASISLLHSTDPSRFIQAFAGSHRHIMDYLIEEVLNRQSMTVQRFLIYTSILERLCAELCELLLSAVSTDDSTTGESLPAHSAQAMLSFLDRNNLFLVPLDDERIWFRYHTLFADLLRQRLSQERPAVVPLLHRCASEWYASHDLVEEAIAHALAAGDNDLAVRLIEQVAEQGFMRGELGLVLGWIEALPPALLHEHPQLAFYDALMLPLSGRPLEAAELRLRQLVAAAPTGALAAAPLFQMMVASYRGDFGVAETHARQALDLLAVPTPLVRSFIAGVLGLARLFAGDTDAARAALAEAAELSQRVGNRTNAVLALVHLAEISFIDGDLVTAEMRYREALDAAGYLHDTQRNPVAGLALVGLGELFYERNQLALARMHVVEGIDLAQRWAVAAATNGYMALALIEQAEGFSAAARAMLARAQQLAAGFDVTRIDDLLVSMRRANLFALQGDEAAMRQWLAREAHEMADILLAPIYRTVHSLAFARVLLATGRSSDALACLDKVVAIVEGTNWMSLLLRALTLRALALNALQQTARAQADICRALILAYPFGYVRLFLDLGEPMRRLLVACRADSLRLPIDQLKPAVQTYLDGLLDSFSTAATPLPAPSTRHPPVAALAEPLTEREYEVLHLIAAGKSNRDIAESLVVSESTVKTHINNLYGKLNVVRRTQAIVRARELGLLE